MATLCIAGPEVLVLTAGVRQFTMQVLSIRGATMRLSNNDNEWAVVTLSPSRDSVVARGRKVDVLNASPEIENCLREEVPL